jgi:hypothetical protein
MECIIVETSSAVKTFTILEWLYDDGDVLTKRALWQCCDYVVLKKEGHCLAQKYDLTEKFILFELSNILTSMLR